MSLPVIAIEPVTSMNHMAEVESRLSEEERRLLSEIRAQKESVLDKIKVRITVVSLLYILYCFMCSCSGTSETDRGH